MQAIENAPEPLFQADEARRLEEIIRARIAARYRRRYGGMFGFGFHLAPPAGRDAADSIAGAWTTVGDYLRLAIVRRHIKNDAVNDEAGGG